MPDSDPTPLLEQILAESKEQTKLLRIIANAANMPFSAASGGSDRPSGGGSNRPDDPPDSETPRGTWQDVVCPIGKNKGLNGKRLGDLPKGFLVFCTEKVERNPKFPDSEFHDALDEYARLAGLRRPDGGEAPAPTPRDFGGGDSGADDEVPF